MPHKLQLVLGAAGGVSHGAYQICNCSPTPRAAPLALFSNAPDPRSPSAKQYADQVKTALVGATTVQYPCT